MTITLHLSNADRELIVAALLNMRDSDVSGGSPEQLSEIRAIDRLLAKIAEETS